MSKFVDECVKELEADLTEAENDGASPEEVLGNAVFDPRSFAASWAIARGFVRRTPSVLATTRRAKWTIAFSAAASVLALLLGLLVLAGNGVRQSAAVQIVRRSIYARGRVRILMTPHRVVLPRPPFLGPGGRLFVAPLPPPLHVLGWVLLLVGVIGSGVTLWLWRPWSTRQRDTGLDETVGLPSYL
jgi:hypothetical protein